MTKIDPEDTNRAYGLCDLGMGFAEFGSVWLSEIIALRGSSACRSNAIYRSRRRAGFLLTSKPRKLKAG